MNDITPAIADVDDLTTATVPVGDLTSGDTPRLSGSSTEHTNMLAETETRLPPILVHRATMRVIDGIHRLEAARIRGQKHIEVRFFDGSEADAFLLAVQANVQHGLPLTLADRTAAAERVLVSHADWSDRAIAAAVGITAKTVSAIRQRSTAKNPQLNTRIGRDGRTRPLNSAKGRRLASVLIAENPDASLRDVAKAAGISPATVQDVRERLKRGDDPVPQGQRTAEQASRPRVVSAPTGTSLNGSAPPSSQASMILQNLRRDPSLRFNEKGRALLRWLDIRTMQAAEYKQFLNQIPPRHTSALIYLARSCAKAWMDFADELEGASRMAARPPRTQGDVTHQRRA